MAGDDGLDSEGGGRGGHALGRESGGGGRRWLRRQRHRGSKRERRKTRRQRQPQTGCQNFRVDWLVFGAIKAKRKRRSANGVDA